MGYIQAGFPRHHTPPMTVGHAKKLVILLTTFQKSRFLSGLLLHVQGQVDVLRDHLHDQ